MSGFDDAAGGIRAAAVHILRSCPQASSVCSRVAALDEPGLCVGALGERVRRQLNHQRARRTIDVRSNSMGADVSLTTSPVAIVTNLRSQNPDTRRRMPVQYEQTLCIPARADVAPVDL